MARVSHISLLFYLYSVACAKTSDQELQQLYKSLPREEFIEYFNKHDFGWRASKHALVYPGETMRQIIGRSKVKLSVRYEVMEGLPESFDARKQWPHCPSIGQVFDEGGCNSAWAYVTTNAMTDRICIASNKTVNLSMQDLECVDPKHELCGGGYSAETYSFWEKTGIVTEDCKPFNLSESYGGQCKKQCVNNIEYESDKHFAVWSYAVPPIEDAIKTEIFKRGPVNTSLMVYTDFASYKNGVYEPKFGVPRGRIWVKLLGWGVENGLSYWLVANTRGTEWGIGGMAKINMFDQIMTLENDIYTGEPKI